MLSACLAVGRDDQDMGRFVSSGNAGRLWITYDPIWRQRVVHGGQSTDTGPTFAAQNYPRRMPLHILVSLRRDMPLYG